MTRVRNFVADLLRGSTSAKEAKKLADSSFGDKVAQDESDFQHIEAD
jgi:hypothetical protein